MKIHFLIHSKYSQVDFVWDEKEAVDKEAMYSFHDVRVAVFLCCDNICKKLLAQKLHMSHLSIPLLLPDITNKNRFVLQTWALRGKLCNCSFLQKNIRDFVFFSDFLVIFGYSLALNVLTRPPMKSYIFQK